MRRETTPVGDIYMGDVPLLEIHARGLNHTRNDPSIEGRTAWNHYARGIAGFYGLPVLEGKYSIATIDNYTSLGYHPTQEDWLSGVFKTT